MSERLNHNPDVLSCLANLSNDEVLTPPEVANAMLDMLPQELFRDPNARFLDPACKSGIFLREIAKRLLEGLKDSIPDRQKRIDHIFHKQLYGFAITELTSLLTRRSLYCSKHANSIYSVTSFEETTGKIRFKRIEHTWDGNGKCQFCGASREQFDRGDELETHAYEFIHINNTKELEKVKFDLIISNPPYQISDGGAQASAKPIYHLFVEQAKKLKPRFLSMIIPARWYSAGKGLESFRANMLQDNRIRILHDYPDASECFPGVQIKAGVCYFLWDRDNKGDCKVTTHLKGKETGPIERPLLEQNCDTFIRYNEAIMILHKVRKRLEPSFMELVSTRMPFGIVNTYKGTQTKQNSDDIKLYISGNDRKYRGGLAFAPKSKMTRGEDLYRKHKVFIGYAGSGSDTFPHSILTKPFYGEPNTACTETYLTIGPFNSKEICDNVISYICTRFFRFLVLLKKPTQHVTKAVHEFVPMQDFSKPWSDDELYTKYGFNLEEISFIESMIRPMDVGGLDE